MSGSIKSNEMVVKKSDGGGMMEDEAMNWGDNALEEEK